ncbi:hypothetical protein OH77DRAFT_1016288 [Trametes cingulata]|nr:hypothetical protein OH77DRAFT_1016288 [Trametes cingulata]
MWSAMSGHAVSERARERPLDILRFSVHQFRTQASSSTHPDKTSVKELGLPRPLLYLIAPLPASALSSRWPGTVWRTAASATAPPRQTGSHTATSGSDWPFATDVAESTGRFVPNLSGRNVSYPQPDATLRLPRTALAFHIPTPQGARLSSVLSVYLGASINPAP